MPAKNIYYNLGNTLSRNKLFNFVLGPRGAGKTYGAKKKAIQNFVEHGEQFVYLRRYETEIPDSQMRNFFDDVEKEFPEHEFKSGKGLFRVDGMIAGWYFPLSKAQLLKSIPFPNVTLIVFDEFIINTGMIHYLPNEVTSFLECYSTIARDRDIPAVFLSNALTFTNPYFVYFDITFEPGQRSKIQGDISIEFIENKGFTEHMNNTRFGKLIAGTAYGDYAINNKFLLDTNTFIEKMTNPGFCTAILVFDSMKVAVYRDSMNNMFFLSDKIDPACKNHISIKADSHNNDTILATRQNVTMRLLTESFTEGLLRFETQAIKNVAFPVFKRLV